MEAGRAAPKPARPPVREPLWLIDTSTLLTLATHEPLRLGVTSYLEPAHVALADVVVDELGNLARYGPTREAWLAGQALGQLEWLGPEVDTSHLDVRDVEDIREQVANGRVIRSEYQHWAESVLIQLAHSLPRRIPHLLSEDYDARVVAYQRHLLPFSTHKLLARMVKERKLDSATAEGFATAVHAAGRGPLCTAAEFESGRLRRVGYP